MNIYDFDNTIYDGESNADIIKFGLKKHFFITLKALRKTRKLNSEYKRGFLEFERVKETMLSFIFEIPNYPKFIDEFVTRNMKKIKPWYYSKKNENDLILSASYELWVKEFASRLGIKNVIATRVDSNGKILGKNCKSEEKLRRLYAVMPNASIASAYSDSKSDECVLEKASVAYVVEGNKLIQYYKGFKFKNEK